MKTLHFFIVSVVMLFLFGSMLYGQSNDPDQKRYAFFINDSLFKATMLSAMNSDNLEGVSMKDTNIVIDGVAYTGTVHYKYSDISKLITLRQVREQYTDLTPTENVIYIVSDRFPNVKSSDDAIIDRDEILRVNILRSGELEYLKDSGLKFTILQIDLKPWDPSLARKLFEKQAKNNK